MYKVILVDTYEPDSNRQEGAQDCAGVAEILNSYERQGWEVISTTPGDATSSHLYVTLHKHS